MDRIAFAGRIISELDDVTSVLDVGCRDCALERNLPTSIAYSGADLAQNASGTVAHVGDIATIELRDTYDCIVALDILEHLENPDVVFARLVEHARKYIVVSLPNCYDLKNRLNVLFRGSLGGKYAFSAVPSRDRHRWIMGRQEIFRFFEAHASRLNLHLKVVEMMYGDFQSVRVASRARAVARILPRNLCVATVFGVFAKAGR